MKRFTLLVLLTALIISSTSAKPKAKYAKITKQELENKIKGAWVGKMVGVSCGIPFEFCAVACTYDGDIPWHSPMIKQALVEDDVYGQLNFMETMEKHGQDVSLDTLAYNFANAKFALCHANLQGRKNYFDGVPVEKLAYPEYSIHADDIDFQIEADFIGLIHPAMPASSNKMCSKVGAIMAYGDGMYGGMFLAAMHSLAFVNNDVETIVREALKAIPAESDYAKGINMVLESYKQNPSDWKAAWQKIEDAFGPYDACSPYIPFNIDAKINGAYIAIGLLFGEGDLKKTMDLTIRCGQDTDCNAANGLATLCAMKGFDGIPAIYTDSLCVLGQNKFLHTTYTFEKLISQTMAFAEENIIKNGGKVKGDTYYIKVQDPVAPKFAPSFDNIRIKDMIVMTNSADMFKLEGSWMDHRNGRGDDALYKMGTPGSVLEIDFNGSGVAIIGNWDIDGGKANVYIDDKLVKEINCYYYAMAGIFMGNRAYLFHKLGLSDGNHTLRLEVIDDKDSRSKGNNVYVEGVIVYK